MFNKYSDDEIDLIGKASIIAANAVHYAGSLLRPGVTTSYIDKKAEEFIKNSGAQCATIGYMGYKHSTCISINEVACHGVPSSQVIIQDGDIVNIDIVVKYNDFHGDYGYTFGVGSVSTKLQHMLYIGRESLIIGAAEVKQGNTTRNIAVAIEKFVKGTGYNIIPNYGGHGIGRNLHEEPFISHHTSNAVDIVFEPGICFTVEPILSMGSSKTKINRQDNFTVYTLDKSPCTQFEWTIAIKSDWSVIKLTNDTKIF